MHIINNNNMVLINMVQDKWILYSDKYVLEKPCPKDKWLPKTNSRPAYYVICLNVFV